MNLRAPLRAIDNLANWISEDAGDVLPEESREHFRKMRQRVRRMEQLLDDLLQYSRVGHDQGDVEEVDTVRLVQDTVEFLEPPEGFTVSTGSELPTLMTYKVPLQQVFRNLIDNAIKHHDKPGGHIHISSENRGDLVEFTVADDGPGIAAEYHDRIFDKFQTLARSDRDATGMGLSIVKRLVENQGGSIRVECEEERGAAFRFYWPKETNGALVHA